jgi:hypothetical protein
MAIWCSVPAPIGTLVLLRRQSPRKRLRQCRDFDRVWIGEQAAVIPLAYNDRLISRRPWVIGVWANPTAGSTFADAVVSL